MHTRKLTTVDLFVASGAETKSIRDKITIGLKELSRQHEKSGFIFQVRWWEEESNAYPLSGRSQDGYNKIIDECDMVAVIIHDTLGKYTKEEFDYAVELFRKTGKIPKVVVYTLPTNADNDVRHAFVKNLRTSQLDYFHCIADNPDNLIDKIKGELLMIKDTYAEELKSAVVSAEDTLTRLEPDSDLTREAIELFEKGDYNAASNMLNINKIRERMRELSVAQKEVASAFVLKAKLELTDVKNKDRFMIAEELFDEALTTCRTPEFLFEYALYCHNQRIYIKSGQLYAEILHMYRRLAADNPAKYIPYVATTLNNLAVLHRNNNEYAQAEEEYREALEIRRELATDNPAAYIPVVAATLHNLAVLHRKNNEYTQAEKECREALEIYRNLAIDNPAEYNPSVATTLNNLANLHSNSDEYAQAEEEYGEALEIYRSLAADNAAAYVPAMAMTLNNLANLHSNNDEYAQAEEEYGEALEVYRRLAADNAAAYIHEVAITLNNLAVLHSNNDEYTQAEEEYGEALEYYRNLAADNPAAYIPDMSTTLNNLASLHSDNNEYTQAEEEYREALDLITPFCSSNPQVYRKRYDMIIKGLNNLLSDENK